MDILAKEIGVPTSELTEECAFAEMGVDSLMSLTISGRFREDLNVEIASSMFVDYPTVRELKRFLAGNNTTNAEPLEISDSSSSEEARLTASSTEVDSESSTTDTEETSPSAFENNNMVNSIRATIAKETGVAMEEIDGSTDLEGIGLDSLMSLTITGRLRESTGEELPPDFFAKNTTMSAIERSLGVEVEAKATPGIEEERLHRHNNGEVTNASDTLGEKTH